MWESQLLYCYKGEKNVHVPCLKKSEENSFLPALTIIPYNLLPLQNLGFQSENGILIHFTSFCMKANIKRLCCSVMISYTIQKYPSFYASLSRHCFSQILYKNSCISVCSDI